MILKPTLSEPETYVDVFNKYITQADKITLGFYPVTEDEHSQVEVIPKGVGEYRYIDNDKEKRFTFVFSSEIDS